VMNKGEEDRITFIFDYVPPQELGRSSETTLVPGHIAGSGTQ
jgi:hypothetical protein